MRGNQPNDFFFPHHKVISGSDFLLLLVWFFFKGGGGYPAHREDQPPPGLAPPTIVTHELLINLGNRKDISVVCFDLPLLWWISVIANRIMHMCAGDYERLI